nr:DUF5996 family protein [Amycolatopsis sp. DSM 110486]
MSESFGAVRPGRLVHAPLVNRRWQVTLYVSPRGLTSPVVPVGEETFDRFADSPNPWPRVAGGSGPPR